MGKFKLYKININDGLDSDTFLTVSDKSIEELRKNAEDMEDSYTSIFIEEVKFVKKHKIHVEQKESEE